MPSANKPLPEPIVIQFLSPHDVIRPQGVKYFTCIYRSFISSKVYRTMHAYAGEAHTLTKYCDVQLLIAAQHMCLWRQIPHVYMH